MGDDAARAVNADTTGRAFLTLRTHGGFAGATDDELLSIPYANLLQALRLASEAARDAARSEWQRAAFVGWQLRSVVVGALGGRASESFGAYLKSLGLAQENTLVEGTSDRARENAERVREAFKRAGVRRSE